MASRFTVEMKIEVRVVVASNFELPSNFRYGPHSEEERHYPYRKWIPGHSS